jgi:hypothetical protein
MKYFHKALVGGLLGAFLILASRGLADDDIIGPPANEAPVPASSLDSVANDFLARFACQKLKWRRDVELNQDPKDPLPDGRQLGYSRFAGWYSYRPATINELSATERRVVFRDKLFLGYLRALRKRSDGEVVSLPAGIARLPELQPDLPANAPPTRRAALWSLWNTPAKIAGPGVEAFEVTASEAIGNDPIHVFLNGGKPAEAP